VFSRELTIIEATPLLGVSYRQAKRLTGRYRAEGRTALVHANTGRRSNRAVPEAHRERVLALVGTHYGGRVARGPGQRFGPTLAAEHLWTDHGVLVAASTLARWMRINADEIEQGTDGCGLPTFALALDAVADGCARFASVASQDGSAPAMIVQAMGGHPEFVAGTDCLDTELMRIAKGRLFAKVGAEGFYCAGVPSMKLGFALKVEDGAKRAAEAALLAVLHRMGVLSTDELSLMARYATPDILNTRQELVGHIRTRIEFE